MKLINIDEVEFVKGVYVNPRTDEPLPVIHKMVSKEVLNWTKEVKAVPIDTIKLLRVLVQSYYLQCDSAVSLLEFVDDALKEIIKNNYEEDFYHRSNGNPFSCRFSPEP